MKMKMEEFLRLLIKIDERLKNALQYKHKRRILHAPPIFYIYEKTNSQAKFIMNDLRKTNGWIHLHLSFSCWLNLMLICGTWIRFTKFFWINSKEYQHNEHPPCHLLLLIFYHLLLPSRPHPSILLIVLMTLKSF